MRIQLANFLIAVLIVSGSANAQILNPETDIGLTALANKCNPGKNIDCNNDVYKTVWKKFQLSNGEYIKVDMEPSPDPKGHIQSLWVYTRMMGRSDLPMIVVEYIFTCTGYYGRLDVDQFANTYIENGSTEEMLQQIACSRPTP